MSYDLKVSVVACCHSKRRLISLVKTSSVCYGGIKGFFLSSFQYTPDMEFNKFVTLWIFSLCLVEKCWTDRTGSCSPEIQAVENGVSNGVSGRFLIILIMCENSLLLYFVYSPVEFREAPLVGRECISVCATSL